MVTPTAPAPTMMYLRSLLFIGKGLSIGKVLSAS
jgi:hypothetical protein